MRIVAFPQWQGATWDGASDVLPAGCRALAGLAGEVLDVAVEHPDVPAAASPTVDGIAHRAALVSWRDTALSLLGPGGPVLTIGGDCGADLVPIGFARAQHGHRLVTAWFDAHADSNTAAGSPSGAFHGMVLRALLGEGDADLAASPALEPGHAVLIGTRAFDPDERRAVDAGLLRHVPPPADPAAVREAVGAETGGPVYLHVDVDVLDPEEWPGGHYREPGGLTVDQLVAGIDALADQHVVGAGLTECATTDGALLRRLTPVIQALGRALGS
ncbi:arginase [Saccharomonospora sp. CUA-673]|uniref:arginase family protein n=1 Tax=Saccharomonospora sp. CUA-673 TaxID=1904969 RepID=UPI00095CD673|nr:arginase family protein [Saccharomonospora sp. CUA-673]OLT46228.1 arginase [Saccharomonospora sp. CUA-673]